MVADPAFRGDEMVTTYIPATATGEGEDRPVASCFFGTPSPADLKSQLS